ncbi:MAG: ABC transporter permease subunit [Alphaproteobacteria bacterium]|nr:ABC transporter permease subunit [Alphaproteobacteria bacterium]
MALENNTIRTGRVGRGITGKVLVGRLGWTVISFLTLLVLWAVVAAIMQSRLFPGPLEVGDKLLSEAASGELFYHVGLTLGRVAAAFIAAMAIGCAIGIALGRAKGADLFFDTWLIFFLNLPALVTIILCYVWFGLTETAAILAVAINKIPNVAVTVREGARSLSRDLNEMSEIYRFGFWKTLRHVTLPQLAPFFAAAARGGLALVWKIVLVVELLGRPNGVGEQLHIGFQLFDVSMILAYAIAFIVVVQVIELCVLQPLEARANRWRR